MSWLGMGRCVGEGVVFGLGTYAFFWQSSDRVDSPLSLQSMVAITGELGGSVFQICDYPAVFSMPDDELVALADYADQLGIRLELGTRGVSVSHLARALRVAQALRAPLVRSLLFAQNESRSEHSAEQDLLQIIPDFEQAEVLLALETYEQVPTERLVSLVERVGSDWLGICLDPANSVAALEKPDEVIERCAPYVRNIHLKDFAFSRNEGWVGFVLSGARLGEGLLDVDRVVEVSRTRPGVSIIVEHWLPWQGDPASTVDMEKRWTDIAVNYLKGLS